MVSTSILFSFLAIGCAAVAAVSVQDKPSFSELFPGLNNLAVEELFAETDASSLDQDIESFEAEYLQPNTLLRYTRDAEGSKHRKHKECCGKNEKVAFTEQEKAILQKCRKEENNGEEKDDGNGKGKGHGWWKNACFTQCFGKNTNLAGGDGYVNADQFSKACQEKYTADSMKEVCKEYAPQCAEKGNEKAKKLMEEQKEKCNPAMSCALKCLVKEMLIHCPGDKKDDSQECKDMIEKIIKKEEKIRNKKED